MKKNLVVMIVGAFLSCAAYAQGGASSGSGLGSANNATGTNGANMASGARNPDGDPRAGTTDTNTGVTNHTDMGTTSTSGNSIAGDGSLDSSTVSSAQRALSSKGYSIQSDGIAGPMTESAVRQFQASNGLSQTGVLDPQTLKALKVDSGQSVDRSSP